MSFERLLKCADQIVAGLELNRVLFETREEMAVPTVGYEVVLDGMEFEDFFHVVLPKMTEHYLAKRLPMLGAPNVVLTLWRDDKAHLFSSESLVRVVCAELEIDETELKRRIVAWRTDAGFEPDPWAQPNRNALSEALLPAPKK